MIAVLGVRRRPDTARYSTVRFILGASGWELVEPTQLLQIGPVKVTRKNGTTRTYQVRRVGEAFDRHGFPFVRGYLGVAAPKTTPGQPPFDHPETNKQPY